MGKKENQRIALTKRLLKESLVRLMSEKSIQKISVSELCQDADINRTTFYNHYGSQYDLLKEMETDMITEMETVWKLKREKQNRTMDKCVEAQCAYLREHDSLAKLLFRNGDADSEFAALLSRSFLVQETFGQLLSDVEDEESKKLMMTFFANGAYGLIRQWILEDIPKTPREMGELVCEMSRYGWESRAAEMMAGSQPDDTQENKK